MDATFHSSSSIHSLLRSKMLNVLVCICIIDSLASFKFVRLACLSSFGWGSWSKCIKRDFHLITPHHHRPREREKRREGNLYVTNNEIWRSCPFFLMVHTYCFGFIFKFLKNKNSFAAWILYFHKFVHDQQKLEICMRRHNALNYFLVIYTLYRMSLKYDQH